MSLYWNNFMVAVGSSVFLLILGMVIFYAKYYPYTYYGIQSAGEQLMDAGEYIVLDLCACFSGGRLCPAFAKKHYLIVFSAIQNPIIQQINN